MPDAPTMTRRAVQIPDDLWDRARAAATRESERTGYRVTVSDLVRIGLARETERVERTRVP